MRVFRSCVLLIFIFSLHVSSAFADTSILEKAAALRAEGKLEKSAALLKETDDKVFAKDKLHLKYFALGYTLSEMKLYSESRTHLLHSLELDQENAAQIYYLVGHTYKEEGDFEKASSAFQKALQNEPPQNISFSAKFEYAQLAASKGQYGIAVEHLRGLEKKWRNTPKYPDVLWQLIKIEFARNQRHTGCQWARKLYSKFPAHSLVKDWSYDLYNNRMDGEKINCLASRDDMKKRIRNLELSGLEARARAEIDQLRATARDEEKYDADLLLAGHLESTGYPDESLQVLINYYAEHQDDFSYQSIMGKVAGRAGEFQTAIGAYHRAYQLSPNSKNGRSSLFTAGFLSYQIQDYDGASRIFSEIVRKFGGSSLGRDAKWHLAWLRYLRGDFQGAEKSFQALMDEKQMLRRRRFTKPFANDRTKYWLGMSLLRQDKFSEARFWLSQLAKDRSYGFYSIAAKNRLQELPQVAPPPPPVMQPSLASRAPASVFNPEGEEILEDKPPSLFSLNGEREGSAIGTDSDEGLIAPPLEDEGSQDTEVPEDTADTIVSEETVAGVGQLPVAKADDDEPTVLAADGDAEGASDGAVSDDTVVVQEGPSLIAGDDNGKAGGLGKLYSVHDEKSGPDLSEDQNQVLVTSFKDPKLRTRFNRAQNLIAMGLKDWAKWELYEIEKRTQNHAYLKTLMDLYIKIGSYNRASYISEVYFSTERNRSGFLQGRLLWEKNFPRAYADIVSTYARDYGVPEALILSIMRAESSFNSEAMSPVGARGLMQLMPYTAEKVAALLDEQFKDESSLHRPEVNIRLGSRYLSRLLKNFQELIPLVAAGYNAGPHRVNGWLSNFGNLDMDEFIEHVPYVETRNYIKKVLRNYAVYNELYGSRPVSFQFLTRPVPVRVTERPAPRENWDGKD